MSGLPRQGVFDPGLFSPCPEPRLFRPAYRRTRVQERALEAGGRLALGSPILPQRYRDWSSIWETVDLPPSASEVRSENHVYY